MKKMFGKTVYDTEESNVIVKNTYGNYGDTDGYEEILFCTPAGNYFVYGNGGEDSPYPAESIVRVAKAKVDEWIEAHK